MQKPIIKLFFVLLIIGLLTQAFASIVDTREAAFTPAQRAWLLDNRQEAKTFYISEIDSAGDQTVPAFNAAYLSYLDHNFDATDKYLKIALSANPKYGPALFLKGLIEYDRHNLRNSFTALQKSIKTHPQSYLPNYYLGKFLYERGKYKDAIEYLKDAISDYKLYTFSYSLLGQLYIDINKLNKAIEILEKGFIYSHDADIIFNLAKAYELSGQTGKAIKYYGLFAYLYEKHPKYESAKAFLNKHHITNYWTNRLEPIPERGDEACFFPVGENYVYSIYWGPIRVGELNTIIHEKLNYKGIDAYKVQFSMDSNPALEFIASLHSDYITIIDQRTKLTLRHFLHQRENSLIADKVYDYDRENGRFMCRTVHEDGHIDYLEKYLPKNCVDGTSILFYARQVVSEHRSEIVMTTIDETFVLTDMIFDNVKEPVEVRGKTENVYRLSGELHYKGIVGFTGNFWGWFRDDNTHLPVSSDFEIWVGRIKVYMATLEEQREHKYWR
ncbi:MAG: DUF3108 domain-containing protein [Candidatus Marinimicrobia bacterium]|nr:DUF3108 domain-containing protein [Candidatus Neomarinimicrobiota bacterium]